MTDKLTETVKRITQAIGWHTTDAAMTGILEDARATILALSRTNRERAAKYVRDGGGRFSEYVAQKIEGGERDSDPLVQMVRAHRVAALRGSQS